MPETPEELHALLMPPVHDWETFPFEGQMRPEDVWQADLERLATALRA